MVVIIKIASYMIRRRPSRLYVAAGVLCQRLTQWMSVIAQCFFLLLFYSSLSILCETVVMSSDTSAKTNLLSWLARSRPATVCRRSPVDPHFHSCYQWSSARRCGYSICRRCGRCPRWPSSLLASSTTILHSHCNHRFAVHRDTAAADALFHPTYM